MTLLSRANLGVVACASVKEFDAGLNGVRVEPDGSTVGSNGRMIMAVEPVDERLVVVREVGERVEPGTSGMVLEKGFAEEVGKALPRGTAGRGVAPVAVMTKCVADPGKAQFVTVNKHGVAKTLARRPKGAKYPDWKKSVREAVGVGGIVARVAVSRKELLQLLTAIDKAVPDPAKELPVFIEIGEKGMLLRAADRLTGQRVLGALGVVHGQDEWPEYGGFERGVLNVEKKSVKRRTT